VAESVRWRNGGTIAKLKGVQRRLEGDDVKSPKARKNGADCVSAGTAKKDSFVNAIHGRS
jgi:hypothetical protein